MQDLGKLNNSRRVIWGIQRQQEVFGCHEIWHTCTHEDKYTHTNTHTHAKGHTLRHTASDPNALTSLWLLNEQPALSPPCSPVESLNAAYQHSLRTERRVLGSSCCSHSADVLVSVFSSPPAESEPQSCSTHLEKDSWSGNKQNKKAVQFAKF